MARKFKVNWDYLGWTETPESLREFQLLSTQESWNNNLLRIIDNLARVINYDDDEGLNLDSIGVHSSLYEKLIKDLTMHRFIKTVKLLGNYTIFIDEKYPINEIHVYAYDSPEEHNGIVRIQNLIERRIFKITPDTTINENNIGEYLKKIENRIKNGKHTGHE